MLQPTWCLSVRTLCRHRYDRAHMPDGRRINRWYLVDQHGSAHLAVIGVERDTRDGHYTYTAVGQEPAGQALEALVRLLSLAVCW